MGRGAGTQGSRRCPCGRLRRRRRSADRLALQPAPCARPRALARRHGWSRRARRRPRTRSDGGRADEILRPAVGAHRPERDRGDGARARGRRRRR